MTKAQAVADFMEQHYPAVVKRYGADDTIALDEEWSYFIDSMCKDGQITDRQYNTWATPSWPKRVLVVR